ncbi:MAG TPA: non-canonical purine NTP pyrophosphatase, RdgB/HAM1 family [Flavobacteriales bacterium]|nr:non-canonical purine NTP pyrophosphatase, RdgB/HAM1 family [Flavobacteriales bacterium]|tara:strand:- start:4908 stop:5507 length:600 start_codon:yes stop_codon:yes gene_type:complete
MKNLREKPVLVFATHNLNKAEEVQQMLGEAYFIKTLVDIGCHEAIPETSDTLEGNARLKAMHVVKHYGVDCFADDTGLEVQFLNGRPGVRTARYASEHANAEENITKLLAELGETTDRQAQFRTSICLIRSGMVEQLDGTCKGRIAEQRSGAKGFGYDPIFIPEGESRTFAEMNSGEKNAISHRGIAIRKMVKTLLASK